MRREKQIALDRFFLLCIFVGLFLACASVFLLMDKDIAVGVLIGLIDILIVFPGAMLLPCVYTFDSEGVSICYIFLPNERYLWKNIRTIQLKNRSVGGRASILDLFYGFVFDIQGEGEGVGKKRFYMQGYVRKSMQTKRLFEKYWDGKITGVFEDVKKSIKKKRASKQVWVKAHAADEIVVMERKIRADAREWLKPFEAQAKKADLQIKSEYVYLTKDLEELKSRPQTRYTYILHVKIERFGKTDDIKVDLLYVRLWKKVYRGTKNKRACEELNLALSDIFKNT